jgi:hypothetical protein
LGYVNGLYVLNVNFVFSFSNIQLCCLLCACMFPFFVGTAVFLRTELTAQHHCTLGPRLLGQPGLVGSFSGSLGAVHPMSFAAPAAHGAAIGEAADSDDAAGDACIGSASHRHGVTHLLDRYVRKTVLHWTSMY